MKNYGVLKGTAIEFKRDSDNSPHSEVLMKVGDVQYRIAINVRSSRGPDYQRLIEYLLVHDFSHPALDHARRLPLGWNDLKDGADDEAALDYIRSNMFRASDMKPVPHLKPGADNDLFEYIENLLGRAINDTDAVVYAFGEKWGPENNKKDAYFNFLPGNGVHMIHMNQGGSGDNHGLYHDGALFIDFPHRGTASALFLKFQNQVWHTDEKDSTAIPGAPAVPEVPIPDTGPVNPWPVIAPDSPYQLARIVAAMVNPVSDDTGHEFVTIINISDQKLNLDGWTILDRNDKAEQITGSVLPGEAFVARLSGAGAQLSNKGGTITLLDAKGLKVDGVAYTKSQAKSQGMPTVFV
ncbi:DUF2278 family protein [Desulfobacter curvatus]|uniref:DUF2278 family protein n=1 Tax=Desulfobacter curvatus TaxID=2290 RepID=UPI00037BEEF6|nr:DUF2278 family protein [Desulfobacter curvatus]